MYRGSKYHINGGRYTMARGNQYNMARGVDIPWVVWGRYAMDRVSKYHG